MFKLIKWLHPKYNCSKNKISLIAYIFFISLLVVIINQFSSDGTKHKSNIINIPNNITYIVNYEDAYKYSLLEHVYFYYNNKKYIIYCNRGKEYRNIMSKFKICQKQYKGHEFTGNDVKLLEFNSSNNVTFVYLLSGNFIPADCSNCEKEFIDIKYNILSKHFRKFDIFISMLVSICLFLSVYLVLQVYYSYQE
ncbi:MAG: hypothetical protein IJM09_05905 [Neisseriaceae bacterium]|nr:hypothetical protein [Neisseriaceae bacterium]